MAQGTVLAELVLEGDKSFKQQIRSAGGEMDDASRDAAGLSGWLGRTAEAMEGTRADALGLSGALTLLAGRADEAGDEIAQAGRRAGVTSGTFTALALSSEGASVAVGTLSAVTALSLVPALAAAASAVVPLVAALGGLAAVGGAIVGVGIVGALGAIATHGEQLKAEFSSLVSLLKSSFAPVFDTAAGVLSTFISAFKEIIPTLVPSQEAVTEIASSFTQLGLSLIEALPAFADLAVALTREFLPAFVRFAQDVLPQVPGLIRDLVGVMEDVAPLMMDLAKAVISVLPELTELGMTVLQVVVPAVADLLGFLEGAIRWFNDLPPALRQVSTAAVLLGSAIATLGGLFGGPLVTAIAKAIPLIIRVGATLAGLSTGALVLIGVVSALAAAWATNFGNIQGHVSDAVTTITRLLGENLGPALRRLAFVTDVVTRAIGAAWRGLKPILEPVFSFIIDFLALGFVNAVDIATAALGGWIQFLTGDFKGAFKTWGSTIRGVLQRVGAFFDKWTQGALTNWINEIIKAVNFIGKRLEKFAQQFGADFTFQALQQFEGFGGGPKGPGPGRGPSHGSAPGSQPSGIVSGGGQRVTVEVTGELRDKDGEIVAVIDDRSRKQAREVTQEQSDRFNRVTGN